MSYSDIEVSQVDPEEEEGTWEVEAVVDMRKIRGRRQFLIKWKDFNSDDNTWEDESNLNCPALVTQFLEEREKKHKHVREERKKEQAKPRKQATPEPKRQQKQAAEPKQTKVKAEPKPTKVKAEPKKQESKRSPSPRKAPEPKKPAQPKKQAQPETAKVEKSPKIDAQPQSVCGAFAKLENGKRRVFYVFRMSNGTEKVLSSSQAKHLDKNMVLDFLVKGFQASERRLFCMTH